MMKQCTLSKGSTEIVAWIPSIFAQEKKFLDLAGENGWLVKQVFNPAMSSEYVISHERDYKTQRQASDV